ncbi:MAG: DNA repair and recombination protein RadB [Halanaeroarchaeum sp.]
MSADDRRLSTGCTTLDDLLGGGLERGTVTQIYGAPASGKTNVALSAVAEAVATGGTAVYIDTEGLSVERFEQVLDGRVDDVAEAASRVVIQEAHDFAEQAEAVRDAQDFSDRADLVVLDSATGFYRLERTEDEERGDALRDVASQVTHLLSLARRDDLVVLVTNQVYSDPDADSDRVRPLGGNTLTHWTGTVLRLDRFRGGKRRATLEKHRSRPEGETAQFSIAADGLESGPQR